MSNSPRYLVTVNGESIEAHVTNIDQDTISFMVEGESYSVRVGVAFLPSAGIQQSVSVAPLPGTPHRAVPGPGSVSTSERAASDGTVSDETVRAPMPGVVVSIPVKKGDTIAPGQTVAVIEAMKMENNIAAPVGGLVASVLAQPGKEVELGQALVTLSNAA